MAILLVKCDYVCFGKWQRPTRQTQLQFNQLFITKEIALASKKLRPPTNFLERARSVLRSMRSNKIAALPDGTTDVMLENLITEATALSELISTMADAIKNKQDARDELHSEIWKITKSGVKHIESRFGDDSVQLEQVGLKRRSKYEKPKRVQVRQTQTTSTGRKQRGKPAKPSADMVLPELHAAPSTNGKHK